MIKKFMVLPISVFIAAVLLFVTAVPVLAFDARSGPDVTIASDEVVDGDVYFAGTNITIDGTVNGDVFAVGQNIRINGTINGGVTVAGQVVALNGKVSNGARIAGQTVTVGARIGRDLMLAASDVTINNAAIIGKDLSSYSASTIINGRVAGNVTGSIANLTLSNEVNGNVIVTTGTLQLSSTANIRGNLNYTSNNTVDIQSGATVAGTTTKIAPPAPRHKPAKGLASAVGSFLFRTYSFVTIFIIGLVLIAIGRKHLMSLAFTIRDQPVSSLGWGALLFFCTPLAAFFVMLTIIGIPISLVSLLIWGLLLYLIQIPVALLIGWLILSRQRDVYSYGFLVGLLALGLAILYALGAIPVLGMIIWLLVMIFGLGSLIALLPRRQKTNIATPLP